MTDPMQLRASTYSPAFNHAVGTVEPYRGTDHTVARMRELAGGARGERSIVVRRHTEQIISNVRPKDYASEVVAICKWWTTAGRYTRDPLHVEMMKDPQLMVEDAVAGRLLADCFPVGTLLLRDDYTFMPIENARPGDRIWGYDKWSTITGHTFKGDLALDAIKLNNGSWLKLTPDHKVYVSRCLKHPEDRASVRTDGGNAYCRCAEREIVRVPVSELRPGQMLLQPDRIAFGAEETDPDRSYVEGLYLSDGWHADGRFSISGQDGCPKEAQKREVQEICARLGLPSAWFRKSIAVNDREWADRMALMGCYAPQKHALSINLAEGSAAPLLRGIMADSGKNTGSAACRTFTTTSRQLMLQTRVLHRMFGISCGYSYIEDHGGLGENPIWRLSTRQPMTGRRPKVLRVKEVVRDISSAPCYDIQTDDHYVYLPEHDITVSNCDDIALAIATGCLCIGAPVEFLTVGFQPRKFMAPKEHTHVLVRAQDPRTKLWFILDPVAGRRTSQMLARVKQFTRFAI